MGRLYLSSIMKVQTAILCFLVAVCLCVNNISAKNLPDINEVEIEKSQADSVLKRNPRGLFGGEEEEKDDDDEDYDYGEEEPDQEEDDNNNRNGKKVDWVNLVVG